jgi:hypothetical protein
VFILPVMKRRLRWQATSFEQAGEGSFCIREHKHLDDSRGMGAWETTSEVISATLRLVDEVERKMHTNLSGSWALGCPKFDGWHVREPNPGSSTIRSRLHAMWTRFSGRWEFGKVS